MTEPKVRPTLWKERITLIVGLCAVAVTAMGLPSMALAQGSKDKVLVIQDTMVPGIGGLEQVSYINDHLEKGWKANNLKPAERCDDYAFIRRASLDIIGRIPKIDEIKQFMNDAPNVRRSKLIERLLASNEYPHHFATMWTTLLLTRSANKMYREQMNLFLYDEFSKKDADWSKTVTELLTAAGKTNENGAVNFILAHLGEEIKQDPKDKGMTFEKYGHYDMVPVTSRSTKLFLGIQTQCTQCHDHPFGQNNLKQNHFWQINAFFRQVDAPQGRPVIRMNNQMMGSGQFTLKDAPGFNKEGLVQFENRKALVFFAKAKFLDGTKMPQNTQKTRRQLLAEFVIASPFFGKAFTNRMWGHFFGISFTKDGIADFGDHNPPSYGPLLEKLSKDWTTKYQHNPKELIRWICNSKAYGLSSVSNKSTTSPESQKFFARMLVKPMSPEQLFESLSLATQPQLVLNSKEQKEKKEDWLKKLVVNFGNDEGEEATFNGTVVQALMLMNGKDINEAIADPKGAVEMAIKLNENVLANIGSHNKIIGYLYLAALNRLPTDHEIKTILSPKTYLLPGQPSPFQMQPAQARAFWKNYYEDLLWAMVNSNEFFLNH
jgi:hypothetical protein